MKKNLKKIINQKIKKLFLQTFNYPVLNKNKTKKFMIIFLKLVIKIKFTIYQMQLNQLKTKI